MVEKKEEPFGTETALGKAYERHPSDATDSLSDFILELMALLDAVIRHHEDGVEQESSAAERAFRNQRRVLTLDKDNGWKAESDGQLLSFLRRTFNKRESNKQRLIDELQEREEETIVVIPGSDWSRADANSNEAASKSIASVPALDPFGLADYDLALKLQAWWGDLRSFLNGGRKRDLLKALQWANTILGSLTSVTLQTAVGSSIGVVAEPIKELKDVIHNLYS